MQVLPVIVPYVKTTSNIAISCRTLRDWLSNNGFAIKSTKKICLETYGFYKLLEHPGMDEWTINEFIRAIKNDDCDLLLLLLDKGVNIEAKDYYGTTALIQATMIGKVKCLRLLLDYKANIEAKNSEGWTALHWATRYTKVECLKLLLQHKANIEAKNIYGNTALTWATHYGKTASLKILLQNGAKVDPELRERHPEYPELWGDSTL